MFCIPLAYFLRGELFKMFRCWAFSLAILYSHICMCSFVLRRCGSARTHLPNLIGVHCIRALNRKNQIYTACQKQPQNSYFNLWFSIFLAEATHGSFCLFLDTSDGADLQEQRFKVSLERPGFRPGDAYPNWPNTHRFTFFTKKLR